MIKNSSYFLVYFLIFILFIHTNNCAKNISYPLIVTCFSDHKELCETNINNPADAALEEKKLNIKPLQPAGASGGFGAPAPGLFGTPAPAATASPVDSQNVTLTLHSRIKDLPHIGSSKIYKYNNIELLATHHKMAIIPKILESTHVDATKNNLGRQIQHYFLTREEKKLFDDINTYTYTKTLKNNYAKSIVRIYKKNGTSWKLIMVILEPKKFKKKKKYTLDDTINLTLEEKKSAPIIRIKINTAENPIDAQLSLQDGKMAGAQAPAPTVPGLTPATPAPALVKPATPEPTPAAPAIPGLTPAPAAPASPAIPEPTPKLVPTTSGAPATQELALDSEQEIEVE